MGPRARGLSLVLAFIIVITVEAGRLQRQQMKAQQHPVNTSIHPVVSTNVGSFEGNVLAESGVQEFLGIRYAAKPERFAPALLMNKTSERFKAKAYGASCVQDPGLYNPTPNLKYSEDCLFLNIWRPANPKGHLPVLVFVHGGDLRVGSGSEPWYNGTHLAQEDLVVVTLNYRLGPLGFLPIHAMPKKGHSQAAWAGTGGMNGIRDVMVALQWVKGNIQKFSGDSNKVTLYGQGGGSCAACILNASPQSKGLFQYAIMSSGPCIIDANAGWGPGNSTQGKLAAVAMQQTVGKWGLKGLRGVQEAITFQWPDSVLQDEMFPGYFLDNWLMSEPPVNAYMKGQLHAKAIIVGSTSKDGISSLRFRHLPELQAELRPPTPTPIPPPTPTPSATGSGISQQQPWSWPQGQWPMDSVQMEDKQVEVFSEGHWWGVGAGAATGSGHTLSASDLKKQKILDKAMQRIWGAASTKVLAQYNISKYNNSAVAAFIQATGDHLVTCPMHWMAGLAVQHIPVFVYDYSHFDKKCDPATKEGLLLANSSHPGWASHGADTDAIFGTHHGVTIVDGISTFDKDCMRSSQEEQLSSSTRKLWATFAKYGDPYGSWPQRYASGSKSDRKTYTLDIQVIPKGKKKFSALTDFDHGNCEFWKQFMLTSDQAKEAKGHKKDFWGSHFGDTLIQGTASNQAVAKPGADDKALVEGFLQEDPDEVVMEEDAADADEVVMEEADETAGAS